MPMNLQIPQLTRRSWLTGLAALLLSACRPVTLLNAVIPDKGMRIHRDIAFGTHSRQRLDIYQPRDQAVTPRPVVVFFYGGSWASGSKQDYLFVAEALTSQGMLVVIADYRLYPELKFPQLMQDPALVLLWVKQHVAEYEGDASRLFLMGHSAGAHLAVMLTLNTVYLAAAGLSPALIKGTIGLAGPYDFLPLTSDTLRAIFAPADQEWQSQPIRFVSGQHPPVLLLAGLKDQTVWPRNSINLARALEAQGSEVKLLTYANYNHVDMVAKLARPLRGNSRLLQDICDWIGQHASA